MITVREILHQLIDHGADGRHLDDEVMIKLDGTLASIDSSYSDGTFILVAGKPLSH